VQVVLSVAGAAQVSKLMLGAGGTTVVLQAGSEQVTIPLNPHLTFAERRWAHLALAAEPAGIGTKVTVSVNGLAAGTAALTTAAAFVPAPGKSVALGGALADRHFVGWVDELRVLSRVPGPEELCRHAHGTLVGVAAGDPGFLFAASYPAATHQAISGALSAAVRAGYGVSAYPRYLCELAVATTAQPQTHYCIDDVRRPQLQPDPHRCVGMALVFPEGPIQVGHKRPDATGNEFCRSCHLASHPSPSLTVGNLAPSIAPVDTPANSRDGMYHLSEFDPRRQPMQPPKWTFGFQPAGLFCVGVPAIAQTSGVLTDRWVAKCP
jgi:Concanavalin A-like lectin/glucanases superfamily